MRKNMSWQTGRAHKHICIQKKIHSNNINVAQSLKLGKANFVILTFSIVFTYNIAYLFFSPAVGMNQFLNEKHLLSARPLFPFLLKLENEQ